MAFFEYHSPRAREVICASLEGMVERFSPSTADRFRTVFAEPMARSSRVRSWRELPLEKLIDLHDLCARTEPASAETAGAA